MYNHMWNGEEKPATVENAKEWTLSVEDEAVAILTEAYEKLAKKVYGRYASLYRDTITQSTSAAAELAKEDFLKNAKMAGIPVWMPEIKNHDF